MIATLLRSYILVAQIELDAISLSMLNASLCKQFQMTFRKSILTGIYFPTLP